MIKSGLDELLQVRILSVVLIGNFNPIIIQPYWLAKKNLINEQEAATAKVNLIHNELCQFDLDWVRFEVTKKRFEIRTAQKAFFQPTFDLLYSIFNLLPETPVEAYGINHIMHVGYYNSERYYEIGNKLAPLDIWSPVIKDPRLLGLEITEITRKDGLPGTLRIRIEPSDVIKEFGVCYSVNDHIAITEGDGKKLVKSLSENWDLSFQRSDDIVNHLYTVL